MPENLVRSVKKALDSLDFVVKASLNGGGANLSDIAAALDEKQPTVRNILKTMESCGYLARRGKSYLPGAKCGDLRRGSLAGKLIALLEPALFGAAAETGESFVLTTLIDGRREVLARFQGSSEVGVNLQTADADRVYSLVTTRIMLAAAEPDELAGFIAANGMPGAEWPEAAAGRLDEALIALRKTGVAVERREQLTACAVALTDASGALLGAIGAYTPTFRATPEQETRMANLLKEIALQTQKQA